MTTAIAKSWSRSESLLRVSEGARDSPTGLTSGVDLSVGSARATSVVIAASTAMDLSSPEIGSVILLIIDAVLS